ncbi:cytochrome-c peroxidase [Bernardetia sp.]|uniref:cytochrome-c peroxidase n=1 Tax=Bernardetia sp. TaxID=1937974 RepID=UPI0025C319D7|nr:cytochrome c peroxidase [Bernardetia sp.]
MDIHKNKIVLCFIFVALLNFTACKEKDEIVVQHQFDNLNLPTEPFNYSDIDFPNHFSSSNLAGIPINSTLATDNTPNDNQITDAGATLGRVLFYDKLLSKNSTVSCASCHAQEKGFSDARILSKGFDSGETRRHSMGLVNARFYQKGTFFWDERAATLEEQVLMPIQDEVEMGLTLDTLITRIEQTDYYKPLFKDAFGDETITNDRISKALAQFVRSLVSYQSKYDIGRASVNRATEPFENFSAQENLGKTLFLEGVPLGGLGCTVCHGTEAFTTPPRSANNGLDAASTTDLGVYESTGNPADIGKFKSPSLRNIALRAPYMHDGRFATLEEVIEHYNSGIQAHPNLDRILTDANGNPIRMNLTEEEKDALVAFLNTLTDTEMIEDEKFSNPFK